MSATVDITFKLNGVERRAAVAASAKEIHPISDVRASDWYRRELVHNILQRMLVHVRDH